MLIFSARYKTCCFKAAVISVVSLVFTKLKKGFEEEIEAVLTRYNTLLYLDFKIKTKGVKNAVLDLLNSYDRF